MTVTYDHRGCTGTLEVTVPADDNDIGIGAWILLVLSVPAIFAVGFNLGIYAAVGAIALASIVGFGLLSWYFAALTREIAFRARDGVLTIDDPSAGGEGLYRGGIRTVALANARVRLGPDGAIRIGPVLGPEVVLPTQSAPDDEVLALAEALTAAAERTQLHKAGRPPEEVRRLAALTQRDRDDPA